MKMNFYGDYYYSLLERNDMTLVNDCLDYWIECNNKNVNAGREDLILFSSQMILAITLARYELTQGNRVNAMREYMLKKAGSEND